MKNDSPIGTSRRAQSSSGSEKSSSQTTRVPVGRSPTSIAVGRDGRQGYVTNLADGTVTILNLAGTA